MLFHPAPSSARISIEFVEITIIAPVSTSCSISQSAAMRRSGSWSAGSLAAIGAIAFVTSESNARWVYAAEGTACALTELVLFFTSRRAKDYRWFGAAYAGFVPAMILWTLDLNRTLCNPDNHSFSGHAAWHLLNAGAFYATFRYYQQFDVLEVLRSVSGRAPGPAR